MQVPQPPPKRKNHKPVAMYGSGSGIPVPVGSAHNVARAISENNYMNHNSRSDHEPPPKLSEKVKHNAHNGNNSHNNRKPKNRICVIDEETDAVIGAGVEMHGEFQFDKLLRVDGKFQGNLFSNNRGDIIVGKAGCIVGDVIIARKMIVEGGHVIGKIVVEELLLQDHTIIKGDITCKLLQIEGPNVTINGRANVHALAPELVDEYDNIITEIPKKTKKPKKEIYAPRSPVRHTVSTEPMRNQEYDDETVHTDLPPHESNHRSPSPIKSTSAQTNASAKPPARSSLPGTRDPEEVAALDAAMAERNAAKERHRQAKLAKKGGNSAETEEIPVVVAEDVVNSALGEVGASPRAPLTSSPNVDRSNSPAKSPGKSPSKLLPPSEEQRKAQLLKDSGAVPKEPEIDSPDVERDKAAVNLQRVARGRLARRSTQQNDVDKELSNSDAPAVDMQKPAQHPIEENDNELERQNKAAVGVQKIARGKLARKNTAAIAAGKKEGSVDNDPPADVAPHSEAPLASAAPEETPAAASEAQADPAGGQAGPFGPGYAESLLQNA